MCPEEKSYLCLRKGLQKTPNIKVQMENSRGMFTLRKDFPF